MNESLYICWEPGYILPSELHLTHDEVGIMRSKGWKIENATGSVVFSVKEAERLFNISTSEARKLLGLYDHEKVSKVRIWYI